MNTASFRYVLARRKTEEAKVNPTLSLGHYVPSFSGGVSNGCASSVDIVLCFIIRHSVILYSRQNNYHNSQSTPHLSEREQNGKHKSHGQEYGYL